MHCFSMLSYTLSSSFFAWSSIAQSVCERAFSLLAICCLRLPNFESCIQQRKTTSLLSIRKSHVCAFQTWCQLSNPVAGMSLELCVWLIFSGTKLMCWTTDNMRCCLSLEVMSSIPAGSTIIYRCLCGFVCVSLCQSIKRKATNMYIARTRAQIKINTHGCWNWPWASQTGCQLFSATPGMSLGLCFWHNFCGMMGTCWTCGSWRRCLSLEVVSSIPVGSTIIYRFLCGFICASLCQSIKIKQICVCIYICICLCIYFTYIYIYSYTFYQCGLTLILAWISNHLHYKVWDEIGYPFQTSRFPPVKFANR